MINNNIFIYTDGACRGNPGPGGWGALLVYANAKKELYGFSADTTNNIMELTAVIESLKSIKRKHPITITTDSNYVKDGITTWIKSWQINNWKTANKKPVKNKELWIKLNKQIVRHTIHWQWVKGHAGNEYNEKADYLARKFIETNQLI